MTWLQPAVVSMFAINLALCDNCIRSRGSSPWSQALVLGTEGKDAYDGCSALILLVLSRIWEVRYDSGDAPCGSGSACECSKCQSSGVDAPGRGRRREVVPATRTCVNHDQKLHETIVDVAWCCGLNNEDVFVSYGLAHCDTGLLVGVVEAHGLCDFYAQPAPCFLIRLLCLTILDKSQESTDRFATSWASSGWEFPVSNLISFDMVDMVKEVQSSRLP